MYGIYNFSDPLTITQEIEVYPNSKPSLFYQNALIQCPNDGCNQKISLSNWFKHIKSPYDYRLAQCPAIECAVTGTPMMFLLILFNVRFTLFGAPAVK